MKNCRCDSHIKHRQPTTIQHEIGINMLEINNNIYMQSFDSLKLTSLIEIACSMPQPFNRWLMTKPVCLQIGISKTINTYAFLSK
jgi:hypothetical protein